MKKKTRPMNNMFRIFVLILLSTFLSQRILFSQELAWIKTIGSNSDITTTLNEVDSNGSVYTYGSFQGNFDVNPNSDDVYLSSNGDSDAYIYKLSPSGDFLWAKSFGSTELDSALSIQIDTSDNIYITGYYTGTVSFDGMTVSSNTNSTDIFVCKIDSLGNVLWVQSIGGSGTDFGFSLAVDAIGNSYILNSFDLPITLTLNSGSVTFDPQSFNDLLITKIDSNGNIQWAKHLEASFISTPKSIALDNQENLIICGAISDDDTVIGQIDVDPSSNQQIVMGRSTFILKLDSNGNYINHVELQSVEIEGVISDINDNAIAYGTYRHGSTVPEVDFDPSTNVYNITEDTSPFSDFDPFILELDSSLNFIEVTTIAGNGSQTIEKMRIDNSGNRYITGYFDKTTDFDPDTGIVNVTSTSNSDDIYIEKFDMNGNFIWVKTFGAGWDDTSFSMAIDNNGDVYSTGYYFGQVDFDPSNGTTTLNSNFNDLVFTSKFNSQGDFLWVKGFGHEKEDWGLSIVADNQSVYVTGFSSSIARSDDNNTVFTSTGKRDIVMSKVDANGNILWGYNLGGEGDDVGVSNALDSNDDLITVGVFEQMVNFNSSTGSSSLTSAGLQDAFILKTSGNGSLIWAKSFSGTSTVLPWSVTTDASDNIYVTGFFQGTIDVDPSSNSFLLNSTGSNDIFICKLNSQGNLIWGQSVGGNGNDIANSITFSNGNVFITGSFQNSADFDASSSNSFLSSNGSSDIFILKLDNNGNYVDVKKVGGSFQDFGYSIDSNSNSIYLSGTFRSTVDFDPSSNSNPLSANGSVDDIFVLKLDHDLNFQWAHSFGTSDNDYSYAVSTDDESSVYLTGLFQGTIDVDPSSSVFEFSSLGGSEDTFILKLDEMGGFVWAVQNSDSSEFNSIRGIDVNSQYDVYTTGKFSGITDFDPSASNSYVQAIGGDDLFIQKLNSNPLSIVDYDSNSQLTIYPNPAERYLHIKDSVEYSSVTITTLGGKIITAEIRNNIIDIQHLSNGIYILSIEDNTGRIHSAKFIKE